MFNPGSICGGRYPAGIWKYNFRQDILWDNEGLTNSFCVSNYFSKDELWTVCSLSRIEDAYVAPSWSWVSSKGHIEYAWNDQSILLGITDDVNEAGEMHRAQSEKWNVQLVQHRNGASVLESIWITLRGIVYHR